MNYNSHVCFVLLAIYARVFEDSASKKLRWKPSLAGFLQGSALGYFYKSDVTGILDTQVTPSRHNTRTFEIHLGLSTGKKLPQVLQFFGYLPKIYRRASPIIKYIFDNGKIKYNLFASISRAIFSRSFTRAQDDLVQGEE